MTTKTDEPTPIRGEVSTPTAVVKSGDAATVSFRAVVHDADAFTAFVARSYKVMYGVPVPDDLPLDEKLFIALVHMRNGASARDVGAVVVNHPVLNRG